jgi:UDP-N-acetylglucosamine acyltransferase
MEIHPTATVSPRAELAEGVIVHPYTYIGPHVTVGAETEIGPHAVVDGWTRIGEGNRICPFTTIGYPPQDTTYNDEPTEVIIGDANLIRENVTIHRGTVRGRSATTVGSENFIMAYAHIAHDCFICNQVVMANASLAGHVRIDDHVVIGGVVVVHQFVRIGTHAFIGGKTGLVKDVPPYMLAAGERGKLFGPNLVGLRRKNFSSEAIQALKQSYKILFRQNLPLDEAIQKVRKEVLATPEVETLLEFLSHSKRGVTR